MNEVLAYRLFRDAGVAAPRTSYIALYITAPETGVKQYRGLYTLVENVDKNFLNDHFGTKKGAIFKPVTPRLFSYLGQDWKEYNQIYDPKSDVSAIEDKFYRLMTNLDFMPNSPTLMNAGRDLGQLSACFVIPVDDSLDSIFEAVKH